MVIKIPKLSVSDLVLAARGEFGVDVTEEMLKAAGMDAEAMTLGLLTKSENIGNSATDKALAQIQSDVAALTAAISAEGEARKSMTATLEATAAPLQADGDVMKVLSDISAGMADLKAVMTKSIEQMAAAVNAVEAVKAEVLGKKEVAAGATTGEVTVDMSNFLHAQEAAIAGAAKSTINIFEFDSVRL